MSDSFKKAIDVLSREFNFVSLKDEELKQQNAAVHISEVTDSLEETMTAPTTNEKKEESVVTQAENQDEFKELCIEEYLAKRAYALGNAAGLTEFNVVKVQIHEILSRVSAKCSRDVIVEFFITPLLECSFKRAKSSLQENNVIKNAICQTYCFQLAFMLHKYNIHNTVILNLNISPVLSIDKDKSTNQNELLRENASFVMLLYTLVYTAYHTNTYSQVLTKEKDKELKKVVYTHYGKIYSPSTNWRNTKVEMVEWYRSLSLVFNYSTCIVPWIENGV